MINKVNSAYYHRTILTLCDLVLVNLMFYLLYVLAPHIIPSPIAYPGRLVFLISTLSFLFSAWIVWRQWRQTMPTMRWVISSTLKITLLYCASCFAALRIIYNAGNFFSFTPHLFYTSSHCQHHHPTTVTSEELFQTFIQCRRIRGRCKYRS